MARVVLVADRFDETIEGLVRGLVQQRQELLLVTDQTAQLFLPEDLRSLIEIITPFKKWNALEALRALPVIGRFNPEVWHFAHLSPDAHHTMAHWVLATFARSQPKQMLISSILSDQVESRRMGRFHFQLYDAITFSTRMQMMQFRREKRIPDSSHAEVLLPAPISATLHGTSVRAEIEDLLRELKSYIFFPLVSSSKTVTALDDLALLVPEFRFLIHQHRHRHTPNLFFAPDLTPYENAEVASRARGVCLAFGEFSIEELRMYFSWAQAAQVPLLVNLEQADRLPGIAVDGRSGWTLPYGLQSLRELLLHDPIRPLKKEATLSGLHFEDANLNQLVRLYHRLYERN